MKMLSFLKKITAKVKSFNIFISFIFAFAIAIASVVCAFFVPGKFFGVPITAIGCFASGWIFSVCIVKVKKHVNEYENTQSLKKENSDLIKENSALTNENAEKDQEIERLKNQRIEINSFTPVLKLALVEADMKVKDVKFEWLNDFSAGIRNPLSKDKHFKDPKRSQYIGVIERSFKMNYGVDLKGVRILDGGNCLYVTGIKPARVGTLAENSKWLVRQVNTYHLKPCKESCSQALGFRHSDGTYYEINSNEKFEGRRDPNSVEQYRYVQERDLIERTNTGAGNEFEWVNKYINNMAEAIVRSILSRTGKEVEFVDEPNSEVLNKKAWRSITNFVEVHNKRIDEDIAKLHNHQAVSVA